ncbi:Molybdopterin synthase catalytic subunit [Penicillium atrosanguineum]|uniref:Molybdopterin synthase catalytic subunit n=1 Tax=Penicillium atrosanguineum TaxID=1132637 RepID=UPI0023A4E072|nr:Molybdopterin synthase catalytic subunit [Penicillium atrosanguineum]KAJ5297041.1 Molybdopterin synthase catalytic subunit [Penicillium atrosanguineum]
MTFERGPSVVDSVTQDAAVMLEFLALSRQHVLQAAQVDRPQKAETLSSTSELLFTGAQVRELMEHHQKCIAWTHNVVHMPTFLDQCEERLCSGGTSIEEDWVSLYYAILAVRTEGLVTLYHAHASKLEEVEIYAGDELAMVCYQKSIESLNQADFMKNHSLFSVQAICLLIYIGHNTGDSDRISVLLASGSRIAQCLAIHRLGPDHKSSISQCTDQILRTRRLIDREISKRVWWFLVRQDWLQIPFNNTYNIHPSQFNTPMPRNCDEEAFKMVVDGEVIQHDQDQYTQGSYTSVLNNVAVIIWKMEDRMCQKRAEEETESSMRDLYSEVLQADREMKQLIAGLPLFSDLK